MKITFQLFGFQVQGNRDYIIEQLGEHQLTSMSEEFDLEDLCPATIYDLSVICERTGRLNQPFITSQ